MESGPPQNGVRAAPKWSQGAILSPHISSHFSYPLICERGELYHLNEHKNLLHICQHVELVNYPFKIWIYPDVSYGEILAGHPGAWLVKKHALYACNHKILTKKSTQNS